ncbi:12281_t:CDS:2 [Dentiscutata erythropus]|uniref:12281_t:CDS:1 n=1 Tax=Dentiscutata erythropus TaxID=1348616 RepID=A0A9N9KDL8_9GLOM|nr:12281_t:CDS:2 [Dentiscutata erythropus]
MHKSTFFNEHHNMVTNDPYSVPFHPSVYYKQTFDISFPHHQQSQHSLYSTGHHNNLNHHVGQVYTTESYPPAFLPTTSSGNSSSDSSPIASPSLLPRRVPSSGGLSEQFIASIRSNRNSILLDPIVEEELPSTHNYFINNIP